jgi:ribosomal-protein-alanine N-acetyltransferase
MIGTCGFTEIYEKEKRAEVGYVIAPKFHRRGFAPEALKKVMEYGFETLGLLQLDARFMEDNLASQKVLLRLGFTPNQTKKESIVKRGKKQRILTYSITREQYRK